MATISLSEPTPLLNSTSDSLRLLQLNTKYQHKSLSNQNYSSVYQHLFYQLRKQKNPHVEISPPEPPPVVQPSESTIIRLVRPKSTQHIDLDSILKSKKSHKTQSKKKNSQNEINSNSINYSLKLRHPSSSLFEPRNIFTPDWTKNKLNSPKATNVLLLNSSIPFDIVSIHSKIEVYEFRIQMGEDEDHLHPALALIAAAESSDNDSFTAVEKSKGTRYEEQKVIQKVPLFWPSRVYDKEEEKMTEQQSAQFEQTIQKEIDSIGKFRQEKQRKNISKSRSIQFPSMIQSKNIKNYSDEKTKKVGRPPKYSTVVSLYFDRLTTDDDDLTDFDF